jgi:hypothetical protein
MNDIGLTISVEWTATRIFRHPYNVVDNKGLARTLAKELHAIIIDYLNLFSARPPVDDYGEDPDEFVKADMIFSILQTTIDLWPDRKAAECETILIYEDLCQWDSDELGERYVRLFDRINGSNFARIAFDGEDGELVG